MNAGTIAVSNRVGADKDKHIADLEAELRLCRAALLDAVTVFSIDTKATWWETYGKVFQRALDSESAMNNVDAGDLYGRNLKDSKP